MKPWNIVLAGFFMLAPGLAGAQVSRKAPDQLSPLALNRVLIPGATTQFQLDAPRSSAMKPGLQGSQALASLGPLQAAMTHPRALAALDQLFDGQSGGKNSDPVAATKYPKFPRGEWYFSWGYSKNAYSRSDMRFSQPSLGNDFTLHGVKAHDDDGWSDGKLLERQLTVPQYNVRLGRFFNKKKDLAIELNYDHAKYVVTHDQTVRMTGTLGGKPVDQDIALTEDVLRYKLNNGANFVLLNLVKRMPLIGQPGRTGSLAGLAKAGVGVVIPHVSNSVFGKSGYEEDGEEGHAHGGHEHKGGHSGHQGFQFGGWDAGLEAGLRFVPLKPFYLEFTNKVDYARYSGIEINQGREKHAFWTHEMILSLGVTIDRSKKKGSSRF